MEGISGGTGVSSPLDGTTAESYEAFKLEQRGIELIPDTRCV